MMSQDMIRFFNAFLFFLFFAYSLYLCNNRPYIYIYAHQNEQDEVGVINISSVRVDNNKALEKLLQVIKIKLMKT